MNLAYSYLAEGRTAEQRAELDRALAEDVTVDEVDAGAPDWWGGESSAALEGEALIAWANAQGFRG